MEPRAFPMTWEEAVAHVRADPSQQKFVRDYFFDDPLVDACERYRQSSEWSEVRRIVGPGSGRLALDVGAGRGISSYALAKDGWAVTSLEPDASSIVGAGAIRGLAAEKGLAIDVVETWGETLPFENERYDLVFCRQVLHHARDLETLCREIARVLKPGGMALALREHVITKPEDLPAFLDIHPLHRLYGGEHAYLLADYVGALTGGGLRLVSVLNPLASDINLYPLSRRELKSRIASKWRLPASFLVPDWLLRVRGERMTDPGRPYSFIATKPR